MQLASSSFLNAPLNAIKFGEENKQVNNSQTSQVDGSSPKNVKKDPNSLSLREMEEVYRVLGQS